MTFKKGQSGNPSGRKKGRIDRRVAWRAELGKELPDVIARLTELAKSGDLDAIRIYMSRTCPPMRASGPAVALPALARARTTADQARAVIDAIAMGKLSPDQGADLLGALASASRVIADVEIARRLEALEAAKEDKRNAR
jgi:hypothetical protein